MPPHGGPIFRGSLCSYRHPGPRRVWKVGSEAAFLTPLPRLPSPPVSSGLLPSPPVSSGCVFQKRPFSCYLPHFCAREVPHLRASIPDASRCFPDASRSLRMPPEASRCLQMPARCFQMFPDASRMLMMMILMMTRTPVCLDACPMMPTP